MSGGREALDTGSYNATSDSHPTLKVSCLMLQAGGAPHDLWYSSIIAACLNAPWPDRPHAVVALLDDQTTSCCRWHSRHLRLLVLCHRCLTASTLEHRVLADLSSARHGMQHAATGVSGLHP